MSARTTLALTALALITGALSASVPASADDKPGHPQHPAHPVHPTHPAHPEHPHSSGNGQSPNSPHGVGMVRLVEMEDVLARADVPDAQVDAVERAGRVAARFGPDRSAGSWWDSKHHRIVVAVVRQPGPATGRLRHQLRVRLDRAGFRKARIKVVRFSQADLDAIVETTDDSLPGMKEVTSAMHDYPHNRAVLTAEHEPTPRLRRELFDSFGNAATLARQPRTFNTTDSRQADHSRFYAGAWIGLFEAHKPKCTIAWSWVTASGAPAMLTAGHCYPYGADGSVATNAEAGYSYSVGRVRTFSFDGTTYSDGFQSRGGTHGRDGDIALIDTTHEDGGMPLRNRSGYPRMWAGGARSDSSTTVTSVDRWTSKGERVCYSGMRRGVQCGVTIHHGDGGYNVADPNAKFRDSGSKFWVTHVARATKGWGKCPQHGDSGAPVYINTPGIGVAAHGILSGGGGGDSDQNVGHYEIGNCDMFFTEIGQAYQHWPGGQVETQ